MAKQNDVVCGTVRRGAKVSPSCTCEVCRILRLSEQQLGHLMEQYALTLDAPRRFDRSSRLSGRGGGARDADAQAGVTGW
jgi:hypothetical protein